MARYRKVDVRIWNDEKFRSLSSPAKLVFFFLMTHPTMTALGAMRHTLDGMAAELDMKGFGEGFPKAFQEVLAKGMAKVDEKASFVWLPNFLKYNVPESPNVVKAWESSLDLLPECHMKTLVITCVIKFSATLPEAFSKALPKAFTKPSESLGEGYALSGAGAGAGAGAGVIPTPPPATSPASPPIRASTSKRTSSLPVGFLRFWDEWPRHHRKCDRSKCVKFWNAHGCEHLASEIIQAVKALKLSHDWTKEAGRFIPAPLVWLGRESWEAPLPIAAPDAQGENFYDHSWEQPDHPKRDSKAEAIRFDMTHDAYLATPHCKDHFPSEYRGEHAQ